MALAVGRLDAWRRDVSASYLDEINRIRPHLADQDEAAEPAVLLYSSQSTPAKQ